MCVWFGVNGQGFRTPACTAQTWVSLVCRFVPCALTQTPYIQALELPEQRETSEIPRNFLGRRDTSAPAPFSYYRDLGG
jgi:hypothetical protein